MTTGVFKKAATIVLFAGFFLSYSSVAKAQRATNSKGATLAIFVSDGTRNPMPSGTPLFVRVFDGNRKQILAKEFRQPSIVVRGVPVYDGPGDLYTVNVSAPGYSDSGVIGIAVRDNTVSVAHVMLLPESSQLQFDFTEASWEKLSPHLRALLSRRVRNQSVRPLVSNRLNENDAQKRYEHLMRTQPKLVAGVLNISTSLEMVPLSGGSALSYLREIECEGGLGQDRIFGYADVRLIAALDQAIADGRFKRTFGAAVFHPNATASFKQREFDDGNLHMTFYEDDIRIIDGAPYVRVEIDMDYYADPLAHFFLEVVPHEITGGKTDPVVIFKLRWMSGRKEGKPDFAPPFTIRHR